jgi:methyl-accepting chemotaxis protein
MKHLLNWKKSLLFKNIVINLLIVLITVLSITGISYQISSRKITKEIENQLSMKLEQTKGEIINTRESLEMQLTLLSKSQEAKAVLQGIDSKDLNELMQSFQENYPDYLENAFLIDASGTVIYDSADSLVGTDLSDREYFKSNLTGEASKSDILISKSTGHNVEVVSVPVKENGKVAGAIAVSMNIEYITSALKEIQVGKSGYAYLIDAQGNFIYHPKKELLNTNIIDVGIPVLTKASEEMKAGKSGRISYSYDGINKLNLYISIDNWSLSVNAAKSEYLQEVNSMMLEILLVGIIMLILASAASAVNAYFTVHKIRKMQLAMGTVTAGDLTVEVKEAKLLKCWEIKQCNKEECPAYQNNNLKCWEFSNTLCNNEVQKDVIIKMESCKNCNVYQATEGDELGQMERSLSLMITTIRSLVTNISNISERLTSSSQELSSASEETTISAEGIADRMDEMSSGSQDQINYAEKVNQMSNDMNSQLLDSVEKIGLMTKDTEIVSNKAETGRKKIQYSIQEMKQIQAQTEKIEQVMKVLLKQSEEIRKINGMITAISSETNLLSLNASIEAARAGEEGRGFAVVAEEIGKLATESQQSAQGIAGLIESITHSIGEAYQLMEQESELVNQGIISVEDSKIAFEDISEKVDVVLHGMNQVVTSVEMAKSTSVSVNEALSRISGIIEDTGADIEEITATTEEQSSISEQISGSAVELSEMSEKLLDAVKQFKL